MGCIDYETFVYLLNRSGRRRGAVVCLLYNKKPRITPRLFLCLNCIAQTGILRIAHGSYHHERPRFARNLRFVSRQTSVYRFFRCSVVLLRWMFYSCESESFRLFKYRHKASNAILIPSSTDGLEKSPSKMFKIIRASKTQFIFFFIFYAECGIIKFPRGGRAFALPGLAYFFFFFLVFMSCRAVKTRTRISSKSFIISKTEMILSSILLTSFPCIYYSILVRVCQWIAGNIF